MNDSGYSEEFLAWMSTLGAHPEWHKDVLENSLGRFMFEAWQAGRRSVVPTQKVYGPRGQCKVHGCEDPATTPDGLCSGHFY